jgi:sorbitol/mannitol transport system substrate-binding protein
VKLVKEHGEAGASTAGFTECLSAMQQGKVAMWYDATSAAGSLEAPKSPVAGKIGYVQAPVKETKASGWLYTWAFMMEKATKNADAAWQFISWATSKEYEGYIGQSEGWAVAPNGTRESLYKNADYMAKSKVFAEPTLKALEAADPTNPGTTPRDVPGIQFMDIPEFTAFGDKVTAEISAAIAGQETVEQALQKGQDIVQSAINSYK